MKMNKKQVFTLALAVCLIAILSMGSLAWFTDEDSIKNDFMIAGSDDADPDDIFSVDVWENTPEGEKEQNGYTYKDILPGDVLKKEVRVENTGSYDQYIRVIVVVTDATQWRTVLGLADGEIPELSAIVGDLKDTIWNPDYKMYDAQNNTFWYSLYYTDKLAVNGVIEVFNTVKIPSNMTREQAATFTGGFNVVVVAQAVQTENVGGNAPAAFTTVGMNAQDAYNKIIANLNTPNP